MKVNFESIRDYIRELARELISVPAKNLSRVQKKHEQIVEGACTLFFEKGFDRTNIREIAEKCGMSLGQLYHYISCKDDILFLVLTHMHERWYQYLVDQEFNKIEDPMELLEKTVRGSIEFHANNKKLVQFIYSDTRHLSRKHLHYVMNLDDVNIIGFYRKILELVNEKYPICMDIDFAARLLPFIIVFIGLRGWNLKNRPVEESIDLVTSFIFRGLCLPQNKDSK